MLPELKAEQNTPQIHSNTKTDSTTNVRPDLFYNSEKYQKLQGINNPIVHSYESENRAKGKIAFHQTNDFLISGHNAPFGSFQFSDNIDNREAKRFIHDVSNIDQHFVIRHYPEFYGSSWISEELVNTGKFEVMKDLNHHIVISNSNSDDFHPMQKRRIRKCQKLGFTVHQTENKAEQEKAYEFIKSCRLEQGLTINISKEKYMASLDIADHYHLFLVKYEEEIVCSSLLVKVNNEVIYNYLPASSARSKKYSPMAFLIDYLLKHYHDAGFKYFDWGQTSIDGVEQESLAQFKERMGAIRSDKYTFTK
ncbi:MAG: GNAT family N-acetyltransferase [bacterium]|nr:GNAT family N-acetyltransferase [bacterium]